MKQINYIAAVAISLLLVRCSSPDSDDKDINQAKHDGYVPNATTAEKIAEAVWLPIYGSSVLEEKPYKARIIGDSVWIVEGVLAHGKSGGTAYIEIRMKDCKVLKVTHGK